MKVCTQCGFPKDESEFGKYRRGKDGRKPHCVLCNRKMARKWGVANKVRVRARSAKWQKENRERYNQYLVEKRRTDPNARLRHAIRTRMLTAVHSDAKAGSAVRDLGCSIQELKAYLESQFKPGMSWDNYGKWHIDHIKPLAKFDLTDRQQFLEACHYTNLQPLWAEENFQKGAA